MRSKAIAVIIAEIFLWLQFAYALDVLNSDPFNISDDSFGYNISSFNLLNGYSDMLEYDSLSPIWLQDAKLNLATPAMSYGEVTITDDSAEIQERFNAQLVLSVTQEEYLTSQKRNNIQFLNDRGYDYIEASIGEEYWLIHFQEDADGNKVTQVVQLDASLSESSDVSGLNWISVAELNSDDEVQNLLRLALSDASGVADKESLDKWTSMKGYKVNEDGSIDFNDWQKIQDIWYRNVGVTLAGSSLELPSSSYLYVNKYQYQTYNQEQEWIYQGYIKHHYIKGEDESVLGISKLITAPTVEDTEYAISFYSSGSSGSGKIVDIDANGLEEIAGEDFQQNLGYERIFQARVSGSDQSHDNTGDNYSVVFGDKQIISQTVEGRATIYEDPKVETGIKDAVFYIEEPCAGGFDIKKAFRFTHHIINGDGVEEQYSYVIEKMKMNDGKVRFDVSVVYSSDSNPKDKLRLHLDIEDSKPGDFSDAYFKELQRQILDSVATEGLEITTLEVSTNFEGKGDGRIRASNSEYNVSLGIESSSPVMFKEKDEGCRDSINMLMDTIFDAQRVLIISDNMKFYNEKPITVSLFGQDVTLPKIEFTCIKRVEGSEDLTVRHDIASEITNEISLAPQIYNFSDGSYAEVKIKDFLQFDVNSQESMNYYVRTTNIYDADGKVINVRSDTFFKTTSDGRHGIAKLFPTNSAGESNEFLNQLNRDVEGYRFYSSVDVTEEKRDVNGATKDALVFTYYNMIPITNLRGESTGENDRRELKTIVDIELGGGRLLERTYGGLHMGCNPGSEELRSEKVYRSDSESGKMVLERALYYDTKEGYRILYQDDKFFLYQGESLRLEPVDTGSLTPINNQWSEVIYDDGNKNTTDNEVPADIRHILKHGFLNVLQNFIDSNNTEEDFGPIFTANMHQYTVKLNPMEEKGIISGVVMDKETKHLVAYFSYHNKCDSDTVIKHGTAAGTLEIWQPNDEYKYKIGIEFGIREYQPIAANPVGRTGFKFSVCEDFVSKQRLKYGNIYLYTPDEQKITDWNSTMLEEEQQSQEDAYNISMLRKMGLMEVINQKWSDLMGRHAFWFPTLRDHNLVYKAEETINLAIGTDSDIRGDGSLGISWIPTDDKAQTTVQNEIEYYRAISNAVPGQVIAIQHDFNVTVGIVVTAALTAISFANDWIMLCRPWQVLNTVDRIMVTNPLGKIIMPAAGKMNILAKAASVISQTISKIPVVGNVWGRLASGAKAVQGLFTGLSSKGILGDMLFRAIFPIVQPTEFIVNTARLVSWGIGLQAAGFLFSGQLKSIGEMPQEDIANLLASQAAFSGVYSYGFGITLPIIALGLKAIKLGELVKYLEMITPQRSGMATDSIANYKRFVAAFWVEEWFIEEVLYPFVLNHGLDLMQLVTGVLRDRSLSFGVMDIELELFRDFIVETVSESLGGG